MIPTTIHFGEASRNSIQDHVRTMFSIPNLDIETKDRYRGVLRVLRSLTRQNEFTLDLHRFEEQDLWDLWGVLPTFYSKIRYSLGRFLDRSPLIKLAECAE